MEQGQALGAGAQPVRANRPPRRRPEQRWLVLLLCALSGLAVAVAAGLLIGNSIRSSPSTGIVSTPHRGGLDAQATWAPGVRPAPPINALRDQHGRLFSLASLHGRTVAMVFFDSHC